MDPARKTLRGAPSWSATSFRNVTWSASTLQAVKQAVPETVVLANTGVCIDNVDEQLSIADGAIVGTAFKQDGVFTNPVDGYRVRAFMDKVKAFRRKNA